MHFIPDFGFYLFWHIDYLLNDSVVFDGQFCRNEYGVYQSAAQYYKPRGAPRNNGKHTYIVLKSNIDRIAKLDLIKQSPRVEKDPLTGILYRFENGKKTTPFEDCELYRGLDGTEYIVTDNVEQFLENGDYEAVQINESYNPEESLNILKSSGDSELLDPYKKAKNVQEIISTL